MSSKTMYCTLLESSGENGNRGRPVQFLAVTVPLTLEHNNENTSDMKRPFIVKENSIWGMKNHVRSCLLEDSGKVLDDPRRCESAGIAKLDVFHCDSCWKELRDRTGDQEL